jgi:ATP-dependent exoDNAse (exonuclease V) beta subunit
VPGRRAAKVDNTAKALRAYAESIAFQVVVINGVIDCLLVWGGVRVYIVDWKSKGGTLTDDQAKLVAKGIPIRFITTTEQLDALKMEARA